jgi:hypothetical protein
MSLVRLILRELRAHARAREKVNLERLMLGELLMQGLCQHAVNVLGALRERVAAIARTLLAARNLSKVSSIKRDLVCHRVKRDQTSYLLGGIFRKSVPYSNHMYLLQATFSVFFFLATSRA